MSCVEGLIIDDDVFLEGTEEFTLELMIDSPSGLAGDTTTIFIEDNDSMSAVHVPYLHAVRSLALAQKG